MTDPESVPVEDADPNEGEGAFRRLAAGTARMAGAQGLRQILSTGALAVTAAVVARVLGSRSFGVFTGGTAAYNLCYQLSDFGFSLILARELSQRRGQQERLMGAAIAAEVAWCLVLTAVLVVLGLTASGKRGDVMLVLCPGLASIGVTVSRQIFSVRFRAAPLVIMDVSTTLLQCAVMVTLALCHASVLLLALNLSAWTCISSALSLWLARGQVNIARPTAGQIWQFVRTAAPQGLASILASLYFTIDLTLLGWLVPAAQLGDYGAAVRLLSVLVMVPGYIVIAGVPGLSQHTENRDDLSRFTGVLSRWICSSAVPLAAGLLVFAHPAIVIVFGHGYLSAVPLLRILIVAAFLTFVSNVCGVVMATMGVVRPQLIFNVLSLVVNVAANLALDHRYGVTAAAWITVGTEIIIVSYGVITIRRRVHLKTIGAAIWRPVLAAAIASAVGTGLGGRSPLAICVAAVTFLVVLTVVGGAPSGLTARLRRS